MCEALGMQQLSAYAVALILAACSTARPTLKVATAAAVTEPPAPPERAPAQVEERRVGDYAMHLISGSFRKQPALLTERVVGRDGAGFVVEYTLEDNDGSRSLRAHFDPNGEVSAVTHFEAGRERPGSLSEYDELMAEVSVVPDENEGLTATTAGTCSVGPAELDCVTKSYRVRVGGSEANLGITGSRSMPGLDLSGEITSADGKVIFRSSLVDRGSDRKSDDSFAAVER
jgi:hypothetical protein